MESTNPDLICIACVAVNLLAVLIVCRMVLKQGMYFLSHEDKFVEYFKKHTQDTITAQNLFNKRIYFLHATDSLYAYRHNTPLSGLPFLIPEEILSGTAPIDAARYFTDNEMKILREGLRTFGEDKRTADICKIFVV